MKVFSGDRLFLVIAMALAFAGIAIFASAALGLLARENASVSHNILVQASLGLGLGVLALALMRSIPIALVKRAAPLLYVASLLLTALVFVPGIGAHANGATRWIDVGFTTIQPAEFLKVGVVLMFAWWLAPRAKVLREPRRGLLPFLTMLLPAVVILLLQPNTSTTLLVVSTATIMYLAAGAPWRDIGILILLGVMALGAVLVVRPYALERIKTFLDPAADSLGSSYQIQQSLIAIGSGGLIGRGFGQSIEKFNYLPEPDGDSVFAVFAEETGFVGSIILLIAFVLLAARGIVIAGDSRDLFGGLVALGFSFLIVLQAFVNICAMLGIIPLTGLPLPFVSHGGTALLVTLAMCGLILNIAAHRKQA
ncbi:MAG TPA: putative peptidoglycan glycosyltransferase FtsW [Candidatus Paceibacterota bacterium]|nr:putative peptidoglycan glycosyltransferase FtsW [Candidatus Paceibacterota bacterium]